MHAPAPVSRPSSARSRAISTLLSSSRQPLQRRVQLVDFDKPGANAFYVTWVWKLKPPARKGTRADVMFVINGVPVARLRLAETCVNTASCPHKPRPQSSPAS